MTWFNALVKATSWGRQRTERRVLCARCSPDRDHGVVLA